MYSTWNQLSLQYFRRNFCKKVIRKQMQIAKCNRIRFFSDATIIAKFFKKVTKADAESHDGYSQQIWTSVWLSQNFVDRRVEKSEPRAEIDNGWFVNGPEFLTRFSRLFRVALAASQRILSARGGPTIARERNEQSTRRGVKCRTTAA